MIFYLLNSNCELMSQLKFLILQYFNDDLWSCVSLHFLQGHLSLLDRKYTTRLDSLHTECSVFYIYRNTIWWYGYTVFTFVLFRIISSSPCPPQPRGGENRAGRDHGKHCWQNAEGNKCCQPWPLGGISGACSGSLSNWNLKKVVYLLHSR